MPHLTYEKEITGLVVIDPYNDFISEGGKDMGSHKGRRRSEPVRSSYGQHS